MGYRPPPRPPRRNKTRAPVRARATPINQSPQNTLTRLPAETKRNPQPPQSQKIIPKTSLTPKASPETLQKKLNNCAGRNPNSRGVLCNSHSAHWAQVNNELQNTLLLVLRPLIDRPNMSQNNAMLTNLNHFRKRKQQNRISKTVLLII